MLSNINDIQRVSYDIRKEEIYCYYTIEDRTIIQPLILGKIEKFASVLGYDTKRFKSFVFIDVNGNKEEFNNIYYKQIKEYINCSFENYSQTLYCSESLDITFDQPKLKDYSIFFLILSYFLIVLLVLAMKLDYIYRYQLDYIKDQCLVQRLK